MKRGRRIKINLKEKFIWQRKSIRKRIEKKFAIKIKDIDIYTQNDSTPRVDITITLPNNNTITSKFYMRKDSFIFSFKPGEIDWALA